MEKLHFISGLPRSGTTLLSTILNQNPRFSASISGPVAPMVRGIVTVAQGQGGFRSQCPEEKRRKLVKNLLQTYYEDSNPVAFDTNRGWTRMTSLIQDISPTSKIICCVRDVPWIIDSFEQLHRKNPYNVSTFFSKAEAVDVYTRTEALLGADRPIGFALNGLKEALYGGERKMILLVNYEDLSKTPGNIVREIYKFIDEPYFEHNFNDVEASYDEYDSDINLPGLHSVRKIISYIARETILPPDLWRKTEPLSFWKIKNP
jgi:sulfotransferase